METRPARILREGYNIYLLEENGQLCTVHKHRLFDVTMGLPVHCADTKERVAANKTVTAAAASAEEKLLNLIFAKTNTAVAGILLPAVQWFLLLSILLLPILLLLMLLLRLILLAFSCHSRCNNISPVSAII